MLHEFLSDNRVELIERCREKVAQRPAPHARGKESEHGITLFLNQLIKTLEVEQTNEPLQSRRVSGASGGKDSVLSEVGEAAAQHGRELHLQGFTVEQVVHDYGDLCQSITDLAFDRDVPIDVDEYRTFNRCLDNAIADAVNEFNVQHDSAAAEHQALAFNERLGIFAHELRNLIQTATLAISVIKDGHVGMGGATGALLDRSMTGLNSLIDRSLAEVRMASEVPMLRVMFSLSDFIGEVKVSATLEAQRRRCSLAVAPVDPNLAVDADRDLLFAAVGNLLQNAFKFTRPGTEVTLNAFALNDRVLIEVGDQGNGLPPGTAEKMFLPFTQAGEDRTGLGLGLSIARRSVEANEGVLRVRNLPGPPGSGCVFTIDLPRHDVKPKAE